MQAEDHKTRVREFVKKMKSSEIPEERNMAVRIELLEVILVNSMQKCTIQRGDIAPFTAITKQENPGQVDNIYLPLDTVVDVFIGRAIASVKDYLQRKVYNEEADEIKSYITNATIDRASYAEGMFDGLSIIGIALLNTINEARMLFQETLNKNQLAVSDDIVRATGNLELDAMIKASLIMSTIKQSDKKGE